MAEDLRSKKFEAFESYMESKGKRKKAKGKKAKKGKKWWLVLILINHMSKTTSWFPLLQIWIVFKSLNKKLTTDRFKKSKFKNQIAKI